MAFPGGSTTRHRRDPTRGHRSGMPTGMPLAISACSSRSGGSDIRSTSTSSVRRMSKGRRLCWSLKVELVPDRLPIGPPADVNLRQVVAARRAKVDVDLETGLAKDLRKIGPELGKHRVSDVSSGMANPRGAVVERAIRTGHDPRKRLGYTRQLGDGEDVVTTRNQDTPDLCQSGRQAGDVLERFRREHKFEAVIRVGEMGEVFRTAPCDDLARPGTRMVVRGLEPWQAGEFFVQTLDSIDLGDLEADDLLGTRPLVDRANRSRGVADLKILEDHRGHPSRPQLGTAVRARAGFFARQRCGQPWREAPQVHGGPQRWHAKNRALARTAVPSCGRD